MADERRHFEWVQRRGDIYDVVIRLHDDDQRLEFKLAPELIVFLRRETFKIFDLHVRFSSKQKPLVYRGRLDESALVNASPEAEEAPVEALTTGGDQPLVGYYALARSEAFIEEGRWLASSGWRRDTTWFEIRKAPQELNLIVDVFGDDDQAPLSGARVTVPTPAGPRTVSADDKGRAEVPGLESGREYQTTIEAEGYRTWAGNLSPGLSQTVYLEKVEPPKTEVLVVNAANQKPVSGAEVEWGDETGRTDDQGLARFKATIPPGETSLLRVTAPGFEPWSQKAPAGERVTAALHPRRDTTRSIVVIRGKEDNQPLSGAAISFHGPEGDFSQKTDETGRAVFKLPADQACRVEVEAPGRQAFKLDNVTPAPLLEFALTLLPKPRVDLHVQVRDRSKASPVAKARVKAQSPTASRETTVPQSGAAVLPGFEEGERVEVSVSAKGFRITSQTVHAFSDKPVNVYLQPKRRSIWPRLFLPLLLLLGAAAGLYFFAPWDFKALYDDLFQTFRPPPPPATTTTSTTSTTLPPAVGPDTARADVSNGVARITVENPGRAGQTAAFHYRGRDYIRRFDAAGRARLQVVLQDYLNQATYTNAAGRAQTVGSLVDADIERYFKLIVQWEAPVELDLYVRPPGAKAPGRSPPVGRILENHGRREGGTKEAAFLAPLPDLANTGLWTFHLYYRDRGDRPRKPYCGNGDLSRVRLRVIVLYSGARSESATAVPSAACGKSLNLSQKYTNIFSRDF